MSEIIRQDNDPGIIELSYGQPIPLFDGAIVDGIGRVRVPERQIALPDIPIATTVSGRLHLTNEFDEFDLHDFDQSLVAQLDKTHVHDLIFKRN